jgi:hypothetical protein
LPDPDPAVDPDPDDDLSLDAEPAAGLSADFLSLVSFFFSDEDDALSLEDDALSLEDDALSLEDDDSEVVLLDESAVSFSRARFLVP